jgi:hypothetical protein
MSGYMCINQNNHTIIFFSLILITKNKKKKL